MSPELAFLIAIGPAAIATVGVIYKVKKRTESNEKISVISESAQSITQAFEALRLINEHQSRFIDILQADARVDKEDLRECNELNNVLQRKLTYMYRKYGNGNGNGNIENKLKGDI